jgi:hypothetical protein
MKTIKSLNLLARPLWPGSILSNRPINPVWVLAFGLLSLPLLAQATSTKVWETQFARESPDQLFSVFTTPERVLLLAGQSASDIGRVRPTANGSFRDYCLVKAETYASRASDKAFGGGIVTSIAAFPDGGYLPGGISGIETINVTGLAQETDSVTPLNPSTALFAQKLKEPMDSRPLNSLYLNLFGDASLVSINYDRLFIISSAFRLSSKIGMGFNEEFQICFFGPCSPPEQYFTLPHHITGNFGKGRILFELGLGGTKIIGTRTQTYILYPIIGYRIMPLTPGKLNFRMYGQLPFSGIVREDIVFIPVGLSIGFSF